MRVALYTFGCKLNQYETEALAAAFRAGGHDVGEVSPGCDLYLVNTCTVTSKSEQKARRFVRALCRSEPQAVIVVTGCYAQVEPAAVRALGANVLCVPQDRKHLLLGLAAASGMPEPRSGRTAELLDALRRGLVDRERAGGSSPFAYAMPEATFHARAFLKIQDGCDYRCAYCRIPLARGPSVSRGIDAVIAEARAIEAAGHREIVVTGVNIASYDDGGLDLAGLLRTLIGGTRAARIRLSSLEPDRLTASLLDVVSDARICPHFHFPVQSLSDRVLGSMKRRYGAEDVSAAVAAIRSRRDDPFIAADLIAGFPGETQADHDTTVALTRRIGFSRLHVFPFSPRPGTTAWGMGPRTPERIRGERTRELRELSAQLHDEYTGRWIGRTAEVLVEEAGRGTTGNYLKVRIVPPVGARGETVNVRLRGTPDAIVGVPCP